MSSPSVFDTPSSAGSASAGGGPSRNINSVPMQAQYGRTILFSNTSNTPMEGSLSKWTNVMKGWQFRWFVLDEATGLLSYYTSKEKMRRGVRRGCIRLQGAVLGIDDEDDANFTITVDAKVFHLQAKDAEEREIWVRALEDAILKHTRLRPCFKSHYFAAGGDPSIQPLIGFEQRLAQADVYLQMLIQQIGDLEGRPELSRVVAKGNEFLSAIKHSIVLLQIAKNTAFPVPDVSTPIILRYAEQDPEIQIGIAIGSEAQEGGGASETVAGNSISKFPSTVSAIRGSEAEIIRTTAVIKSPARIIQSPVSPTDKNPVLFSYSSSDDEQDFYDAEDFGEENREETEYSIGSSKEESVEPESESSKSELLHDSMVMKKAGGSGSAVRASQAPRKLSVDEVDYDSLYDNPSDDELDSLESHGSVISHLLSQVKIGMDLTKVVLPTFILERRSLLEMYADFFAHPDMFVDITDSRTPRDRIVAVLRWYLGSFHAGRRSEVAKKPYNPILGEVFQCYWDLPAKDSSLSTKSPNSGDDPESSNISNAKLLPWVENDDAVMFFAEQVSHHPPISAFYAEHLGKKISLNAHIWTKSKFLGLSIGVINIGHALLTLHSPVREDYVLGFPNGYARSILTTPWVELGGPVTISCTQTGFNATVEFKTKPFFSGEKNRITAQVFSPEEKKKPFLTVEGEWNGLMTGKWSDGRTEKFVDVKRLNITKKRARRIADQDVFESRRMWKDVTAGLKFKDIDKATEAKFKLEEKQRQEARHRAERKESWRPRKFIPAGDTWIFTDPLEQRLKQLQKTRTEGSGAGTGNSLLSSNTS